MNTQSSFTYNKSRRIRPWIYIVILIVNVCIFVCIGGIYIRYIESYSDKLFDENVNNVENLNAASANAAYTYINSMEIKINDIINYIRINSLNVEQTTKLLNESNTDPDKQLQLVHCGSYGSTGELSFGDYSGISVRNVIQDDGTFTTQVNDIVYGSGYYNVLKSFTDIYDKNNHCFTPEFTDPDTKQKCFAVYRHVKLTDNDGKDKCYAILLAVNSKTALDAYNMQSKYTGQSTVLINEYGDYIIKNNDYRNTNFYDYIVNYNNLTLDYRTRLQDDVANAVNDSQHLVNLFYKNHTGTDCIFSVAFINNGWCSITCVPLSSFSLEDNSVNYSLIIVLLFVILFIIDAIIIFFVRKVMSYNTAVAEHATQEAVQANQAKSRFLSTMTHELRTPLNAIIGFASLSRNSIEDRSVLNDYLKKIDISSKLLLQLISDILDVSAIESNKLKLNMGEFNLAKLITSLSTIYYDQCTGKGIEFNVILSDIKSEILVGDSVRVNQILLNYLSNAVKFTPSGGKVTLKVEVTERDADSATIKFGVQDTGCGISDELKSRLFKPFERVSGEAARRYHGTGLGLSIAKNLTELMNGSINVDSIEGTGSCFSSTIPFTLPADVVPHSFNPINSLRVLAVISDEDERSYIDQVLSNICVVHSVSGTATEALQLLTEESTCDVPYNICILDWKMSDLNAIDATINIRNTLSTADLRIIILAYDLAEAKKSAISAGANQIFNKPVFSSELYNTLTELTSDHAMVLPDTEPHYDLRDKLALLIEDNSINTEIALLMLEKIGMSAETAADGKQGYEKFAASPKGYYSVILMDIQMPVMDGYAATAAIRTCTHPDAKTIPILAMTADAFSKDVDMAHEAGMNEHISKPIEPEKLYSILTQYLC